MGVREATLLLLALCGCQGETEEDSGRSFVELVEPGGAEVRPATLPRRGDLVVVETRTGPTVNVVWGVPADTWTFVEVDGGTGVAVNGEVLETPSGAPYRLEDGTRRMLGRYAGAVPADAFLVLGADPPLPGRAPFGLVHVDHLAGIVTSEGPS